ncbi:MAG TPA: hypothetical protein VET88_01870 [Gammaproteobacteria bacterium]|nr:hypothetical protein [Gammaproteobacteria bacterium]
MNHHCVIVESMNKNISSEPHTLVALYSTPEVNRITGFASATAQLSAKELAARYLELRALAPCRHREGKKYFQGRPGITSSGQRSNRREEHLAMALRNAFSRNNPTQLENGQVLSFLDYQTPLKERRDDKGIGKVDLFGVIDDTMPCVVELKVPTIHDSVSDTPLRAFLEAFAYCAVIEANSSDISAEAAALFDMQFTQGRPALCVMAPDSYWLAWLEHQRAGAWWPQLEELASDIEAILGLESHFVALQDADFEMGLDGKPPKLIGACRPVSVSSLVAEMDSGGW